MITPPHTIVQEGFQGAWVAAVRWLSENDWNYRNLVVHVGDPKVFVSAPHGAVTDFCLAHGIKTPRIVAYTIFPHALYKHCRTAHALFQSYNRSNGLYDRVMRRARGWGTYFRRMTCYGTDGGTVNQLGSIIAAIRTRKEVHSAAYTLVIAHPGTETTRPRGGPCLNYLAVQLDAGARQLALMGVYRNHDFLTKAYGNYWGLCNLLCFLAEQTGMRPGPLTCVSSRAYVDSLKREFLAQVDSLGI